MAKANIAFGRLMRSSGEPEGGGLVFKTESLSSEDLTPGVANSASTGTATETGMFVRIATDTTCYAAFGTAPDATVAGARVLLLANTVNVFEIPRTHKVAVAT